MNFEPIEDEPTPPEYISKVFEEDPEPFDLDAFLDYWTLQADPRYQEDKKLFDMEQSCGGDEY